MKLSDAIKYDETSSTCLRWRGDKTEVTADAVDMPLAEIVWEIIRGKKERWEFIEHVNGDPSNNRIYNLKLVDFNEQLKGKSRRKPIETGLRWIQYRKTAKSQYLDVNFVGKGGQLATQTFDIAKFPSREAAITAAIAYRNQRILAKFQSKATPPKQ